MLARFLLNMKKEDKNNFWVRDILILSIILITATVFRLYKINTPLADLHSWRQADTAAVARNFIKYDFDLLKPRFDDLSSVASGLDNPQGYRMVEFPLYSGLFASLYKYLPSIPLEVYGRLTTIVFSLIIITIIYFLLLKESGQLAAIIGSLVYAIFPFFVFFSRVILPDTMALSMAFLSILFLYLFVPKKRNIKNTVFYILSAFFFALGLLIKPTVIFFYLVILYLFVKKYSSQVFKKLQFYLFFIISAVPFLWWRYYIISYPEGIPAVDTLITLVNTYQGKQNIFFKPAFFRWVFFERINNIILGGYLTVFFILGVLSKSKNQFLFSILLSSLIYLFVFQGGNVQHEYYQILILPALAMFVGLGVNHLFVNHKQLRTLIFISLVTFSIFLFSFFFSFYRVRDYYNYSNDLLSIAKIIKDLTGEKDKIITDTTGDTTLLYLSQRRGAPATYRTLRELKSIGYAYFVTLNREVVEKIKKEETFELIFENDKVSIFKL